MKIKRGDTYPEGLPENHEVIFWASDFDGHWVVYRPKKNLMRGNVDDAKTATGKWNEEMSIYNVTGGFKCENEVGGQVKFILHGNQYDIQWFSDKDNCACAAWDDGELFDTVYIRK